MNRIGCRRTQKLLDGVSEISGLIALVLGCLAVVIIVSSFGTVNIWDYFVPLFMAFLAFVGIIVISVIKVLSWVVAWTKARIKPLFIFNHVNVDIVLLQQMDKLSDAARCERPFPDLQDVADPLGYMLYRLLRYFRYAVPA